MERQHDEPPLSNELSGIIRNYRTAELMTAEEAVPKIVNSY